MQHALTRAQPELDADGLAVWQQLGRLAGPGERQAAALALLLWPGNDAERRAWDETVRGVQGAASLRDRIGRCFALHTGVLTDLHFDQLVIEKRLFDGCDEPVVDAALADVNDRLERMRE